MNENSANPVKSPLQSHTVGPMIDLKHLWLMAVINWRWLVVSVLACLSAAGLYFWFAPSTVVVTGKMEIIDKSKKGGSLSAGLAMLNNLPMGIGSALGGSLGASLGIDSEKEILISNTLVHNVVKDLGLYTEYKLLNWGREKILYQNQPVSVSIDDSHLLWMDRELPLTYHEIRLTICKDSEGYQVETMLKENKKKTYLPDQTFSQLPAIIKTEAGTLTLKENKLTSKELEDIGDTYKMEVTIAPPCDIAEEFIKHLSVEPPSKKVNNILNIALTDGNVMRAIDFVNHLVVAYNQYANDDKNEEARKTDEFVNARLAKVDAELGSSDEDWENYKKQFQITDPSVDAQEVMAKKSLYETQLVEIGTQLQLHDYLSEYVNDPANLFEVIPLSLGVSSINSRGGDNSAVAVQSSSLISQHNNLINQRKELLKSMSEKAPQVERITESVKELHPVIKNAMKRDRQSILMKRSAVEREYGRYMGRVGNAPQQERVLTEIGRQREIKQGVYLIMLQKREETAMELANVTDKGKLIDEALMVKNSKRPQLKMLMLAAVSLGIFLFACALLVFQMLKSKVDSVIDLANLSKLPVIGLIPSSDSDESVRNLRTQLLLQEPRTKKVLMVVSYNTGDGKSFIAKKLTESLSQIGKKVEYVNLNFRDGSTKSPFGHPADYLSSSEFTERLTTLKANNDYVVVDTPALNKYSDAYQIAQYAEITCYIVKAGSTPNSAVLSLNSDKRLPNPCYIINAIDMSKKKNKIFFKQLLVSMALLFMFSACGSSEKVVYLENVEQIKKEANKTLFDAHIMPKDILTITVNTINKEAAAPFNMTVLNAGSTNALSAQPTLQTYLVDNDGTIDFPIVGTISVSGLTKKECEAMIREKIRPYLAESEKPIVTVRMSSYSISVLGEVAKPGSFQVSREKINIFEALAQAGDMTIYGVRDKVRLIREDANGNKDIHILDLTDANIINSPYYYLQQNDIVYVEPSNIKKQNARVGSVTTLWVSATSILVSVASLIVNILR